MGSVMNVKIELPQHYIETEGSLVQRPLRSLKDGDAFAVFDEYGDIGVIGTGVVIVNSVPLAQSRESGDAPSHGGYVQTDLVGGHRALQITSLSRGGDRGAAPPAQCAAQKIDDAARL